MTIMIANLISDYNDYLHAPEPCWFYMKGSCKYGNRCKYVHSIDMYKKYQTAYVYLEPLQKFIQEHLQKIKENKENEKEIKSKKQLEVKYLRIYIQDSKEKGVRGVKYMKVFDNLKFHKMGHISIDDNEFLYDKLDQDPTAELTRIYSIKIV